MSTELLLRSNEKGDKKQLLSLNSAFFFQAPFLVRSTEEGIL